MLLLERINKALFGRLNRINDILQLLRPFSSVEIAHHYWVQQYLVDVNDESGEVVKLHESTEELKADINALTKLIERTEHQLILN